MAQGGGQWGSCPPCCPVLAAPSCVQACRAELEGQVGGSESATNVVGPVTLMSCVGPEPAWLCLQMPGSLCRSSSLTFLPCCVRDGGPRPRADATFHPRGGCVLASWLRGGTRDGVRSVGPRSMAPSASTSSYLDATSLAGRAGGAQPGKVLTLPFLLWLGGGGCGKQVSMTSAVRVCVCDIPRAGLP